MDSIIPSLHIFCTKDLKVITRYEWSEKGFMKRTDQKEIWKKFKILGEKQGSMRLKDLAREFNLPEEDTLSFLRQVFPVGIGVEIYHKDHEQWVDFKGESVQYMLPLTPPEWIALHDLLTREKKLPPILSSLKKKITENGPIKVVMELFSELELWDQELNEFQQDLVHKLDHAIEAKQRIGLQTNENKTYHVFPCKVLHLEGQLALIAEDFQDHCLLVIPVKDVKSYVENQTNSTPKVSVFELEEFITAIRSMSEKETRLILKIHDPQSTNLFPDHHFLGKPCMVTNPNGDLIWAAYVEPCEALYEWLISLGRKVEILDPVRFKQEYLIYCEEKLKKVA
jgi:hypothetical protein